MARNTSKDLRNQVIYQIFTRNYKEGTFKAVEHDLDRIKELGTDIVYLLPIQPSGKVHRKGSLGSPYAISDYRAVDPAQGTMEDFVSLCDRIHEMGMKVMLDVVYNHTSPDSVLSVEHPEWFYKKADGSFGNRIGDWWDVIDLDYSNKDLWTYQIDTLKMWALYVDGFRCDVAPLLPLDFWMEARREVETVRPGCIWLAETADPFFIAALRKDGIAALSDSEIYQAFDMCYDYDIYYNFEFALNGRAPLSTYMERVNLQETIYPDNYCKTRFLENHDRPRAAALIPDEKILRNWTAWSYFMKGCTFVYAGQEACAVHHPTLFDLDTVNFETGKDLSGLMKSLAAIKKDPLFAEGIFHCELMGKHDDVILATYEAPRGFEGEHKKALAVISTEGAAQSVKLELQDGTYINAIDGSEVDVFERTVRIDGEPVVILL